MKPGFTARKKKKQKLQSISCGICERASGFFAWPRPKFLLPSLNFEPFLPSFLLGARSLLLSSPYLKIFHLRRFERASGYSTATAAAAAYLRQRVRRSGRRNKRQRASLLKSEGRTDGRTDGRGDESNRSSD